MRMNAHLILANIRPLPPVEAIDALAASLSSREIQAAGSAAVALGRLSPTTPRAAEMATNALATEKVPDRLEAIIYGIGEARSVAPSLIEGVTGKLTHGDTRVVFAALDCLGNLVRQPVPPSRRFANWQTRMPRSRGSRSNPPGACSPRLSEDRLATCAQLSSGSSKLEQPHV